MTSVKYALANIIGIHGENAPAAAAPTERALLTTLLVLDFVGVLQNSANTSPDPCVSGASSINVWAYLFTLVSNSAAFLVDAFLSQARKAAKYPAPLSSRNFTMESRLRALSPLIAGTRRGTEGVESALSF